MGQEGDVARDTMSRDTDGKVRLQLSVAKVQLVLALRTRSTMDTTSLVEDDEMLCRCPVDLL